MSINKEIGKQAYIYLIGKIISYIINFGLIILLARVLGAKDYGIFSLGVTIILMFYSIFNFGIESALAYYVPRFKEDNKHKMVNKIFNTIVIIRITTGIIGSIIMYFTSNIFEAIYNIENLSSIIKIFSIGFLGYSITYLSPSIFQAFKKFKQSMLSDIVISIIKLVSILITINLGIYCITLSYSISLLISSIFILILIHKKVNPLKYRGLNIKPFLKYSLITYLGSISGFIINSVGNLFIGSLPIEVSFLSISRKIGMLITLPATTLSVSLLPNISSMNNKQKINKSYSTITNYSILITSFLSFFFIIINKGFINILLGDTYANAELIINLMIIGYFLNGISISTQTLEQGTEKPKQVTYALIIQGITSLILMIILTPKIHGLGVAISFIISNLIFGLFLIKKITKQGFKYNFSYLIKILITITISSSAYLLQGLIIKSLTFTGLFIIIGFLTRSLRMYDIKLVWKALKNTKKLIK